MGSNPTGSARALQVINLGGFSFSKGHQDREFTAYDTETPERAKVWVRAERSEPISAKAGYLVSASRPRIAAATAGQSHRLRCIVVQRLTPLGPSSNVWPTRLSV